MPNIVLPQTFQPPYAFKRSIVIQDASVDKNEKLPGYCLPSGDLELEHGTINHYLDCLLRHKGKDMFGIYSTINVELRSVFDFYVQAPDNEEAKKIAISITGCRCYQSSDESYDVRIKDNFGVSSAKWKINSDLIVTLDESATTEDLYYKEPVYRKNLWHEGKKHKGRKVNKHPHGDADLSSLNPSAIAHGEGWDLGLTFKTGLILPAGSFYTMGVGLALSYECKANDVTIHTKIIDRWRFREIKVWQY